MSVIVLSIESLHWLTDLVNECLFEWVFYENIWTWNVDVKRKKLKKNVIKDTKKWNEVRLHFGECDLHIIIDYDSIHIYMQTLAQITPILILNYN